MFLTLVGLTALGVGGVGASEAVTAFLDRKRFDIAILKSLGADGRLVFLVFFLQVMAIALAAVILGAAIGATAPFLLAHFYGDVLPLPPALGIYPGATAAGGRLRAVVGGRLFRAAAGRAREIPPASLLRETVAPDRTRLRACLSARAPARRRPGHRGSDAGAGALAAFAAEFLGGAIVLLALLRLVAEGLTRDLAQAAAPALAAAAAGAGQSDPAGRGDRAAWSPRWAWA